MGRLLFLLLLALQAAPSAPPPDTEIFLAPLAPDGTVGRPVNVSNSPGYDNQPSFTPDGGAMLFTSIRGGLKRGLAVRSSVISSRLRGRPFFFPASPFVLH